MLRALLPLLILVSCALESAPPSNRYPSSPIVPSSNCGNGQLDAGEACDGANLGSATCAGLGLGTGTLACQSNCQMDTSGCSNACQPDCSTRQCGPDPVCGLSCGTCAPSQQCAPSTGVCETTAADAPVFLSFATNITTMRPNDSLTFSAVLTDPDGIDDLIGGTLIDVASGNSYGAFTTAASEGSYSLTLQWSDINTVNPITTSGPSGIQRTFTAEFYDQAGHLASNQTTVTLRCSSSQETPCAGECHNLQSDSWHCGACFEAISNYEGLACVNGAPACGDPSYTLCGDRCVNLSWDMEHCGACFNAAPIGGSCEGGTPQCPDNFSWLDDWQLCTLDGGATQCANLNASRSHCGACNAACAYDCLEGECWDTWTSGAIRDGSRGIQEPCDTVCANQDAECVDTSFQADSCTGSWGCSRIQLSYGDNCGNLQWVYCECGVQQETTDPGPTSGTWTCAQENYDADDGCDCGCGIIDPDCDGNSTVFACEYCGNPGSCSNQQCEGVNPLDNAVCG